MKATGNLAKNRAIKRHGGYHAAGLVWFAIESWRNYRYRRALTTFPPQVSLYPFLIRPFALRPADREADRLVLQRLFRHRRLRVLVLDLRFTMMKLLYNEIQDYARSIINFISLSWSPAWIPDILTLISQPSFN